MTGPLSFYLTEVISDALFKLYFTIVLVICIWRYVRAMNYKGLSQFQSMDVRPTMIVPVLIAAIFQLIDVCLIMGYLGHLIVSNFEDSNSTFLLVQQLIMIFTDWLMISSILFVWIKIVQ